MEGVAHRARFAALTTAITRRLPFGLSEVVAPSLVGYLLINLCTFFVDLGLLGLFHGTFRWPIPAAVTLSYGTASLISYVLNRILNFRSHDDVGRQFPLYVAVSASNYLIFVLGLTDLLSSVGVYYELSRVIAACCEAVYLYTMLRFVVFRGSPGAMGAREQVTAATDPDVTDPDVTEPGVTEPEVTEPDVTEPEAGSESAAQEPPPTQTAPARPR
jgi:putative flippase GtrA